MLLRAPILLLTCKLLSAAACVAITGDTILVADLAKTQSGFDSLNPGLVYSFAPAIGNQRVLPASDIAQWAAAHGLHDFQAQPACFERQSWHIAAADVETAVRSMFPDASDLRVEVLEICNCMVPYGKLHFPATGASPPPANHPDLPSVWHGSVETDPGRIFPVWVRMRVLSKHIEFQASADLPAGEAIRPEQIEQVIVMDSPLRRSGPGNAAEFSGMVPTRSMKRGDRLELSMVVPPLLVERGSMVNVFVIDGATQLSFQARAETSARTGEMVTLLNTTSQERFQARVTGPGTSEIVLGPNASKSPNTLEKNTSVNTTIAKKNL